MIYIIIPTTKERRERLNKCIESIRLNNFPVTICIYEGEDGGYVRAVLNTLQGINGLCFILGDDAILDKDCIKTLYEKYESLDNKEEWLLQPYEQIQKGNLATMPFCHSDIIKRYLFSGYKHNYSDTELTDRMLAMGRYLPVLEAKINHEHFTCGAEIDETYKKNNATMEEDRLLYLKRKNNYD